MREVYIENIKVCEVPYALIPTNVRVYKRLDNSYEVLTWLEDEPEHITGNSDNIELFWVKLKDRADKELVNGSLKDVKITDETDEGYLDFFKEQKKKEIASDRYDDEISGITVNGFEINTERDSQALITGAALAALQDESYILKWKAENGFIELNATQVVSIANAVRAHVQNCFNREAECIAQIDACTNMDDLNNIHY